MLWHFVFALASATYVTAQGGGIVEIGNAFKYHPVGTTACGEVGTDLGLWMGVNQVYLNEFGCGHPVRIFSGNNSTVVPIGDLCPTSLCRATNDIELPPAVFTALGQPDASVLVDIEWNP